MADFNDRSITPSKGGGVIHDLAVRIKLILRLMADPRVSPWLKILPVGSLVYLIVPDILPGPVDDAAVIWLGTYLFVELCPPEIVQEHMKLLSGTAPAQAQDPLADEDEIIDAEFTEEDKS